MPKKKKFGAVKRNCCHTRKLDGLREKAGVKKYYLFVLLDCVPSYIEYFLCSYSVATCAGA